MACNSKPRRNRPSRVRAIMPRLCGRLVALPLTRKWRGEVQRFNSELAPDVAPLTVLPAPDRAPPAAPSAPLSTPPDFPPKSGRIDIPVGSEPVAETEGGSTCDSGANWLRVLLKSGAAKPCEPPCGPLRAAPGPSNFGSYSGWFHAGCADFAAGCSGHGGAGKGRAVNGAAGSMAGTAASFTGA